MGCRSTTGIIIVGGDGLLHEVINGADSFPYATTGPPFQVVRKGLCKRCSETANRMNRFLIFLYDVCNHLWSEPFPP
ncbi:diacylglycerol kinase family protein [Peribacillus sp. NPDC097284]|uniref:diacylglycerol kinase family protein n=1 Tax=Peribacillus sp. NPDC097284 TaxID=3364401 RepID=UPI00380BE1D6